MRFREDLLERLRSCLGRQADWHGVERCFAERLPDDEAEDARPLIDAFGYMLVVSGRDELREREGVFGAQIQIGGRVFPRPLLEIEDAELMLWERYADATGDQPLAASRLNDLLWVRRHGEDLGARGRAAFEGYLGLAQEVESMDAVESLLRATEIATEMKDHGRVAEAVARSMEMGRAEIETGEEWRPGIPLNLLEEIVELAPEHHPEELGEVLAAAAVRYRRDPYIAQSVSELQEALAGPNEREVIQRSQVARWREEAAAGDGLMRYVRLQEALGLARRYGLAELAEEILAEMQSIDEADLDMKPIGASFEVTKEESEEVDRHIESYGALGSWQAALERFGSEGPPSGDAAANAELTRELAERYPLHRIFPTVVLGPHAAPITTAAGDQEHDRIELARHEAMRILIWAPIGVRVLDKIGEAYGEPGREELTEFFTTELIDPEVGARIADSLLRHLSGDLEGALHILIPQLEAAIRGVAARAGIVVIKTPRGEDPGGVRALGSILAALEGRIDESWRRYLRNALTDVLGINLRNLVSHGLHGRANETQLAIALHIACRLRLWRLTADAEEQPDA
jgi:hypothetical protein